MVLFNNLKITEFYPYRTAIVTGICIAEDTSISKIVKSFQKIMDINLIIIFALL